MYKLVGPILVKNDLDEAKGNVTKRMEFIKRELGRLDDKKKQTQTKVAQQQDKLMKFQALLQQQRAAQQQAPSAQTPAQ